MFNRNECAQFFEGNVHSLGSMLSKRASYLIICEVLCRVIQHWNNVIEGAVRGQTRTMQVFGVFNVIY